MNNMREKSSEDSEMGSGRVSEDEGEEWESMSRKNPLQGETRLARVSVAECMAYLFALR